MVLLCLLLGVSMAAALPGCSGCRKSPAQRKQEAEERRRKEAEIRARKEREKPKPNFEVSRLVTQPDSNRPPGSFYKPGHWTSTALAAKANNFDFLGNLEVIQVGEKQTPVPLPAVPFRLTTARQVALPKRQPKAFESVIYVPATAVPVSASCRLSYRRGGRRAWSFGNRIARMPSYQYHFVVLARWPERYGYLKTLDTVKPPVDTFDNDPMEPYYRLSLFQADRRVPLPSHALMWTSTACVLWDDAEPGALSSDQQQALLDWLHWGGQLIISGPDTLDTLAGSFLAPYLPATAATSRRQITAADFDQFVAWSGAAKSKQIRPPQLAQPWTGVELKLRPSARFVPGSGDLLAERRAGRGRLLVSAFRLSGRELVAWNPGIDELLNAMLLRRPPRRFTGSPDNKLGDLQVEWNDRRNRLDAARISKLRYFARDSGSDFRTYGADAIARNVDSFELLPSAPGMAAWNDSSPVARHARRALQEAAEIEIPNRSFVVWMIGGYLLVLVPANWLVFRLLGRVEWAWAAAPVVAVICTIIVVRLAQLDIGFARSRTEIAVMELQGGYARAHVSRYTALYSSLTTRYDFEFDGAGAAALPFPTVAEPRQFRMFPGQRYSSVCYRRDRNARLEGFLVRSNTTGMIHAEQMVDLGGAISLLRTPDGSARLVNRTPLTLRNAIVVRRKGDQRQSMRLGTLRPEAAVAVIDSPKEAPERIGQLDLEMLSELAAGGDDLGPGEMRLVAVAEDEIPGMTVRPSAPQVRRVALVVAHLGYGPGEDPRPDTNTRADPAPAPRQISDRFPFPPGAQSGGVCHYAPTNPDT